MSATTLRRRAVQLHIDALQLAADLRDARSAAEPGEKGRFRYPLRNIEDAIPKLARAAGAAK